jgi:hypothetical protein
MQEDSEMRYALALERLEKTPATLAGLLGRLEVFPIHSNITVQRMVMNPRHDKLVLRVD